MATQGMTLKEAYILLNIERTASIDEVKQAYRKRAFELHPDLNPNNKNAVHDFQKVNEAYVTIISYLDSQDKKKNAKAHVFDDAKSAKNNQQASYQEAKRKEEEKRKEERLRKEQERKERLERERKETERRQARERARAEEERRRRLQEEILRQDEKRKAKVEEDRQNIMRKLEEKAQEFRNIIINQMDEARKQREQREKRGASSYSSTGKPIYSKNGEQFEDKIHKQHFEKVMENDKTQGMYEEIYQTLNDNKREVIRPNLEVKKKEKKVKENFTPVKNSATKDNSVSQAIIKASAEPFQGIKKGISSWFKNQIDEELELVLPASKLQPGTKMRLQFRVGLTNELQTIELTLPKDFVPGKPLRLKGMGKKIGKWQGDLYLKLQSK